jgi:hypothetical protein
VREVLPLDPLHHQVAAAGIVDRAEHLHDAGVVQPREQPALDLEARCVALVEQALGRDLAAVGIDGLVDAPHRAPCRPRTQPIAADELRARPWSVHGPTVPQRERNTAQSRSAQAVAEAWRRGVADAVGMVAVAEHARLLVAGGEPVRSRA